MGGTLSASQGGPLGPDTFLTFFFSWSSRQPPLSSLSKDHLGQVSYITDGVTEDQNGLRSLSRLGTKRH